MPRKNPPPTLSKEERLRRRLAADVAAEAIERIKAQGLVKSLDYRHWPGITLDRALAQSPYDMRDVTEISFMDWLACNDPSFVIGQHTVGYWADQHTQEQVIAMLTDYVFAMRSRTPAILADA
jgi:hypothetical protein